MRDYTDEANLNARIYAMRSRLLTLPDYVSLSSNQNEPLFDKAAGTPDHIAEGEIVFREQIASIMPLAESTRIYAPLFLAFFRQFEALNAKLILAKAFDLQSLEQWYDIGPYAILKPSLLKETNTLQNIQPLLTGTYLAEVLEDVSSYEMMAISVDLCAARNLYATSDLFTREAKRDFRELMGRRIAVTSTILSLRLKNTYKWDDEKIRPFLEKYFSIFDGNLRLQVNVVENVLDRHLEQVRAGNAQGFSVVDVEHYLDQYYYNWISSMFHRDFHSICCVVAYLWLLFYQIRNLFKIMEGRRFGFSPERILGRIVCNT